MARRNIVEAIIGLAERLESGSTTLGDFLRADTRLPPVCGASPSETHFDIEEVEALTKLSRAALSGHRKNDVSYDRITRMVDLIGRGVVLGTIDEQFLNDIGRA